MEATSKRYSRLGGRLILRLAWVLLGLLTLAALEAKTPPTRQHRGLGSDGRIYAAIADCERGAELAKRTRAKVEARRPPAEYRHKEKLWALAHTAPFCWRVGTPLLCRLLPGDTPKNLAQVSFAAHLGSWVLLGYLLAALGAGSGARTFAGLLWLSATAAIRLSLRQPAYLDPLTGLLWLAGLLQIARGRDRWLPLFLGLAVLQKESLLLLIPAALCARWWRQRQATPKGLAWAACLALLPALVLGVVHFLIVPINAYDPFGYWLKVLHNQLLRWEESPRLLVGLLVGSGVLGLLPLARPLGFLRFLRRDPWLLFIFLAGVFAYFGGHDKTRLLGPSLPLLTLFAARSWETIRPVRRWIVLPWLLLSAGVHLYLGAQLERWTPGLPNAGRILPGRAPMPAVHRTLTLLWPFALSWLVATWLMLGFGTRSNRDGDLRPPAGPA